MILQRRLKVQKTRTVVGLSGSKMKLLLPDGYTKLKRSNVINQIVKAVQNTEVVYQKIVDYSNNAVIIWKASKEKTMDCFWCEIVRGDLVLKEHEAAKWLTKDQFGMVDWLPADITIIETIRTLI